MSKKAIATPETAAGTSVATTTEAQESPPKWQVDFLAAERLRRTRIPERFSAKTFDTFKVDRDRQRKNVLQMARSYVDSFNFQKEEPPHGLILEGVVGCGKTHIACAILRGVVDKGYSGLYYNVVDLFSDIRDTYNKESTHNEKDLLHEVLAPDLLVLDDLGCERPSEWVTERLYLLVNRRYESGKPIVATTNLSISELGQKLGERILSRFCESCAWYNDFPEEDYRRKHMR